MIKELSTYQQKALSKLQEFFNQSVASYPWRARYGSTVYNLSHTDLTSARFFINRILTQQFYTQDDAKKLSRYIKAAHYAKYNNESA